MTPTFASEMSSAPEATDSHMKQDTVCTVGHRLLMAAGAYPAWSVALVRNPGFLSPLNI